MFKRMYHTTYGLFSDLDRKVRKKYGYDLLPHILIEQTKRHFYFKQPCSAETKNIFKITNVLLDHLGNEMNVPNFDQNEFDKQYDRIITGTMILVMMIEDMNIFQKKSNPHFLYLQESDFDKKLDPFKELCQLCKIDKEKLNFALLKYVTPTWYWEVVEEFILTIGQKALEEKTIRFDGKIRKDLFPKFAKIISPNRFDRYELQIQNENKSTIKP